MLLNNLFIVCKKINNEKIYIDDFKIYTNGNPPGSLEPSSITHDLAIIDELSYITNTQNGIIKKMSPIFSMVLHIFWFNLLDMISMHT